MRRAAPCKRAASPCVSAVWSPSTASTSPCRGRAARRMGPNSAGNEHLLQVPDRPAQKPSAGDVLFVARRSPAVAATPSPAWGSASRRRCPTLFDGLSARDNVWTGRALWRPVASPSDARMGRWAGRHHQDRRPRRQPARAASASSSKLAMVIAPGSPDLILLDGPPPA